MDYLNGYGKSSCEHCGLNRTDEGFDGCVGKLEGVKNACCGHGDISTAYVQFDSENYDKDHNHNLLTGIEAHVYILANSKVNNGRRVIRDINSFLDEL